MQTTTEPMHGDMPNARVPLIGFAARSGTGKTTLLCRLIPWLKQQGLRVGLVKHAHHEFEVDKPGKDSFELRKAGASPVMLSSSNRRAMITEHPEPFEPLLNEELRFIDQDAVDILLVEGFKQAHFPKLELHRPALAHEPLYLRDPWIIAIATDAKLTPTPPIPCLDLNDPEQIGEFLLRRLEGSRP